MASSGTYSFSPSIGSITLSAFERIQLRGPSVRQEHLLTAQREFNYMLSQLSNQQPNLWKVILVSESLVDGQATYDVDAKVVMILDAYVSTNFGETNQIDLYVTPISRTDYASYANKSTAGRPTTYWFDRLINPTVTMWPVPNADDTWTFSYYACTQMQDANLASGETPDIPYRWIDALVAGLAHRLARVYAQPLEQQRKMDAKEALDIAMTQDTEGPPLSLIPGIGSYYR